ncbi:M1 family metallopeptidase [Streptomyces sp. NPDC006610]|uniref:M1 family metallopeptidase n=1 Tax=Streptomyces sp. NPDC006610 TaxID=3154584 RepID=UPI0033B7A9BB
MVSRLPRISDVPRSVPLVPFALLVPLAAVTLAACGGGGDSREGDGDGGRRAGVRGTPGAPGVRDPYFPKAGNGGYDAVHYALDLSYTPATRRLTGTATVTARATQHLSALNLDLEGLDVHEAAVDGRPARWHRAGQELTVRPPRHLREGAVFRVTVRYSGRPVTVTDPDGSQEGWLPTADGALALGQPTGSMAWYPGNHHPSDKATYDITVTVPEGLRAVGNGELRGETTRRGRTTYAWHAGQPMASYLTTVAIGRFDVERGMAGGHPSYVAVDPEEAEASRAVLGRLPEVMEWAQRNFGPYPFDSTGAIVERAADAGYALETQNRPVFPGAPDVVLLVHEVAHQWYGDSVTPKTWRDMWLNEGFATYAEWLWQEDHGGPTAEETFASLYDGGQASPDIWAFPPAEPPDAEHVSERPVYVRGAMVLHRVRRTLGDDAAFRSLLRAWASAHRHGNADTKDFTAFVERRVPDRDFTAVWDDWLYGEGRPPRP